MHMSGESLLVILVVGVIAGWLAGQLVRGFGFGLIGNLVLGIPMPADNRVRVSAGRAARQVRCGDRTVRLLGPAGDPIARHDNGGHNQANDFDLRHARHLQRRRSTSQRLVK